MEQTHPHSHGDGQAHSHAHSHLDGHPHSHDHEHDAAESCVTPEERTKALLRYMIEHNEHHAGELADLLDSVEGDARKKLLEAIGSFEVGNVQLREVLDLLD